MSKLPLAGDVESWLARNAGIDNPAASQFRGWLDLLKVFWLM